MFDVVGVGDGIGSIAGSVAQGNDQRGGNCREVDGVGSLSGALKQLVLSPVIRELEGVITSSPGEQVVAGAAFDHIVSGTTKDGCCCGTLNPDRVVSIPAAYVDRQCDVVADGQRVIPIASIEVDGIDTVEDRFAIRSVCDGECDRASTKGGGLQPKTVIRIDCTLGAEQSPALAARTDYQRVVG